MVKQGYKETEVGLIPEDWAVRTLETIYNITSSKRVFQSQWRKSGVPFYRAREIAVMSEGKSAPEDLYIDENLYDLYTRQYGSIKKDDVLITGVGTLGKVYVVKESDQFYFKDGNIIWLQYNGGFSSQYLKHQYDMPVLINQVFGNAGGSTVATYTITNAKATKVPVPPLDEQECIAEALSDVDSMISSLEKLIAKKKAVKQGAMQELLTGKKRLPGFTGEWDKKKLSDCADRIIVGLATSVTQYYRERGTVIFRNLNILPNKLDDSDILFLDSDFANSCPNKKIKTDDVLTVHTGYVGISCLVPEKYDGALTFTTLITTTKKHILISRYLMVHLNSELGKKMIEMLQAGGGRNNLNVSDFEQYEIEFPKDTREQNAIASILSDMDNEIEALEQKLAKTRQIKQGMMQQLLTGKIRLN